MSTPAEIAAVRAAYAAQVASALPDASVEAAFAKVPRESFLDPGPWPIVAGIGRYALSPDADPVHIYADNLIGIVPARGLNNGQPSLHAFLLVHAKPAKGEHVVHIGTGWGYYTAIMAEMVGPSGRVTGIEFDPDLASRARANLAPYPNVEIVAGDGAVAPFAAADVIYVNAGATRPAKTWLDRLTDGGRLVLPLTTAEGFTVPNDGNAAAVRGSIFLITRRAGAYDAKWISPVAIFPCAGARDPSSERALAKALAAGRWQDVTRLYRDPDNIPDERCFLKGDGWCLAYC